MPTLRIIRNAAMASNIGDLAGLLKVSNSARCTVKMIRLVATDRGATGDFEQRLTWFSPESLSLIAHFLPVFGRK
jgi:hypothetical protein